jgi:two-component system phosphate regulon response regulator PhoB
VRHRDADVDQMYNALFREFLTFMMEDPRNITACMHLHFIAKNIERMGDHVTSIAEQVIYLVTGEMPFDDRPKADDTATAGLHPRADGWPPRRHGRDPLVLVVEDEPAQREVLAYNLEAEGFRVAKAETGDEALLLTAEGARPDRAGLDAAQCLGHRGLPPGSRPGTRRAASPIIMLSARSEEVDLVRGLETGADDYVVKPYSVVELMARVRAQLRRTRPATVGERLEFGDIVLDAEQHKVFRGDTMLKLGPTEFRLLATFMEKPGRVWSREQLLDRVWGRDIYVDARTVDVHIGRLRKALCRMAVRTRCAPCAAPATRWGRPARDLAVAALYLATARTRGAAGRRRRHGRSRRADLRAGGGRRRSAEAARAG